MLIRVKNNLTDFAVGKSYLASAGTAAQTVFTLKNAAGFKASYAMQLGETGEEMTETLLIAGTPSATLATASAASFAHPADTPVYNYYYNKVVIYRSTAGTAGTATAITGGTINLTPDQEYTVYNDTSASAGYAWKTAFYNSGLDVTSSLSDWIPFTGFQAYALGGLRERAKRNVNADIPDDTWNGWLQEWQQEMNNGAVQVNKDYSMGTVDVTLTAGTPQEGTITNEDFMKPRRVWMIDTSGTYQATHIKYNGWYPNESFNNAAPRFYFRGNTVIGRLPVGETGTARIAYDSAGTVMATDSDLLPIPMRPYWKSFIDYSLSRAYRHPSIKDRTGAERLETQAYTLKDKFIKDITPRDQTSIEMVNIVEDEGLDSGEWPW